MQQQPHAHIAQSFERAWQHQDIVALGGILADTLEWRENPAGIPLTSKAQVITHWQDRLATQSNLNVRVTLLDFVDNRSYHHCTASWTDAKTGAHTQDAIFKVELNPEGRITQFAMWAG